VSLLLAPPASALEDSPSQPRGKRERTAQPAVGLVIEPLEESVRPLSEWLREDRNRRLEWLAVQRPTATSREFRAERFKVHHRELDRVDTLDVDSRRRDEMLPSP
jgi:hypothetical protein